MADVQLVGAEAARETARCNKSPRAHYLEDLQRWVDGRQYEHLADWFAADVPLFKRAPCFVYPIVRNAIDSNLDLLLGNARWPAFNVTVEDEQGEERATESNDVTDAIAEAHRRVRFRTVAKEVFGTGQSCRSGCVTFGVVNGRLSATTIDPAKCEPEFDEDGKVSRLVVQYPFFEDALGADGKWHRVTKLYRRVIDGKVDVEYEPRVADKHGSPLDESGWREKRKAVHGFGFCPVVWYAHMRGCSIEGSFDGRAIHELLLDEVRAHDFSVSQRHRAALMAGDPQWTEIGVRRGTGPTAPGYVVEMDGTPRGGSPSEPIYDQTTNQIVGYKGDNPANSRWISGSTEKMGRRKGPGEVWQYDNPNAKVQLHTLPGDALKAIDDNARDQRIKLAESLAVVFLDADAFKFASALSGKALQLLRARQINRCDQYRDDFGDNFLIPASLMLLRIIAKVGEGALRFPRRLMAAVQRAAELDESDITLAWPSYFTPDLEDEQKEAATVRDDLEAGIITLRSAVERRAQRYGIDDVEGYLKELETEKGAADKALHDAVEKLNADAEDGDEGAPAKRGGSARGGADESDRGAADDE